MEKQQNSVYFTKRVEPRVALFVNWFIKIRYDVRCIENIKLRFSVKYIVDKLDKLQEENK